MRVDINSQLSSISLFSTDLKRIQTPHSLFRDSGADKIFTTSQAAEFKFESKFKPQPVIRQSIQKAIPECNQRFWQQNRWPSSWGSPPAHLGQVRWGSTNTWHFWVSCSHFGHWQACLRKSVLPRLQFWLSLRVKKVFVHSKFQAVTRHFFFMQNELGNFLWILKLLQTKAAPLIQSFNHLLISDSDSE